MGYEMVESRKTQRAATSCNERGKAAQLERIRALSPREKLLLAARLSSAARAMQRLARGRGGR